MINILYFINRSNRGKKNILSQPTTKMTTTLQIQQPVLYLLYWPYTAIVLHTVVLSHDTRGQNILNTDTNKWNNFWFSHDVSSRRGLNKFVSYRIINSRVNSLHLFAPKLHADCSWKHDIIETVKLVNISQRYCVLYSKTCAWCLVFRRLVKERNQSFGSGI